MSKQIKELTGVEHYLGTEYEVKLITEKINKLVYQVNELTEAVDVLKERLDDKE